jgi:hypothetical protein
MKKKNYFHTNFLISVIIVYTFVEKKAKTKTKKKTFPIKAFLTSFIITWYKTLRCSSYDDALFFGAFYFLSKMFKTIFAFYFSTLSSCFSFYSFLILNDLLTIKNLESNINTCVVKMITKSNW